MNHQTILSPKYASCWSDYAREAGGDAAADREHFQRRLYRLGRRITYPPPLFAKSYLDDLAEASVALVKIVASIPDRIFAGDHRAWMEFLGVPEADADFLAAFCRPHLLQRATQFARPDFLPSESGSQVTEINVSVPIGGMAPTEPYVDEFVDSGFGRYLARQGAHFERPPTSAVWLEALLAQCPVARSVRAPILFEALADPEDPDASRQAFVNLAGRGGFTVVSGLVTELTVAPDGVYIYGQRVHTVYTMFTWHELKKHVPYGLIRALVAADADGLVDFVGSPVTALFDHKANFELLTDERFARHFDADELALLRRVVPPTFRVTPERVFDAIARQPSLVIKPADEYGGHGVAFGAKMPAVEWEARVREAATGTKSYVCQQVVSDLWRYEVTISGETRRYTTCLGPMVFGGKYAGALLRQTHQGGETPVINATNGAEEGGGLAVW